MPTQLRVALAVLVPFTAVDQFIKWWAWRHLSTARINGGGDALAPARIGAWFANPIQGAGMDFLDAVLLATAFWLLLRHRRRLPVVLAGSAMLAGWSSNLLDRLGLHYLTAPGSIRGAVDFLHIGTHYYNIADLVIIPATPLFVVLYIWASLFQRRASSPITRRVSLKQTLRSAYTRLAAFTGAASVGLAASIGAINYGTLNLPATALANATTPYLAYVPTH